jgi:integrase
VPIHVCVRQDLLAIWTQRGEPDTGAVSLSQRGEPYAYTRGLGGNPLAKAHRAACSTAKIAGFRVHDWRHHWASQMVLSGCALHSLMRLCGWTTPRMVKRYAAVSGEQMAEAIGRLR